MVAAGGVLVELVADRAVALPPLDRETALELVAPAARSRRCWPATAAPLRRTPRALADALVALGQLAVELGDHLAGVDLNPVIVGPASAYVVDALVLPRTR